MADLACRIYQIGSGKQQQTDIVNDDILNIHYDSITACSTFIGGKLLVGFKHKTDFHPQKICSVMQLVILEALLCK